MREHKTEAELEGSMGGAAVIKTTVDKLRSLRDLEQILIHFRSTFKIQDNFQMLF